MLPFCALGMVLVPVFIRISRPEATFKQMLGMVDWIGGVLFISSATGFLIAISWGGTSYAWNHWRTLVPLILGGFGLVATMIYERFGASNPFLRHSLFHVKSAHGVYIGAFVQGLVVSPSLLPRWSPILINCLQLYAQLYYIPFYFESAKLFSPIRTGYSLLPILLTLIPASVVVGAAITRSGKYLWAIAIGWILTTLGTGLTISWDRKTHTAVWAVELIILGLGHGLNLNALNTASQAVSKPGDEGRAVGMYAFLRSFGMAIGVGVSGSVFQNVMTSKLKDLGLSSDIAKNAEAYLQVLKKMPDGPERQAIVDAYVHGFNGVFAFLTALAGVALVLGLFIKHHEINKELITEHKISDHARTSWRRSGATVSRESIGFTPATENNSAMQSREVLVEHHV